MGGVSPMSEAADKFAAIMFSKRGGCGVAYKSSHLTDRYASMD